MKEKPFIAHTWSAFIANLYERNIINSAEYDFLLNPDNSFKEISNFLSVEKFRMINKEFLYQKRLVS